MFYCDLKFQQGLILAVFGFGKAKDFRVNNY